MQIRQINWSEILSYLDTTSDYTKPVTIKLFLSIAPTVEQCPELNEILLRVREIYGRHGIYLDVKEIEWLKENEVGIPESHNIGELFQNWRHASKLSNKLIKEQTKGILLYLADDNCDFQKIAAQNNGHFAIGQEYMFGLGMSQCIINMRGGNTPTEQKMFKEYPRYPSNMNTVVALIAHEIGHSLGAQHDFTEYNGHKSIMHSPMYREHDEDDVFFSGKSIGEMFACIIYQNVYDSQFDMPLLINNEPCIAVKRNTNSDYLFTIPEGKLLDIKVLTQPYKISGKNSLIDFVKSKTNDYILYDNSFELINWHHKQSGREGNYAYYAEVGLDNGKIIKTAPCVVHLD